MERRFKRIMGYQQLWILDAKLKNFNKKGIDIKLRVI